MELEKINGLNKVTIDKIKKAGYKDVESLKGLVEKELVELGISKKVANEILQLLKKLEPPKGSDTKKVKEEFSLEKENKHLVAGFKATKEYNEDLKGKDLEKAFNKFKEA